MVLLPPPFTLSQYPDEELNHFQLSLLIEQLEHEREGAGTRKCRTCLPLAPPAAGLQHLRLSRGLKPLSVGHLEASASAWGHP